MQEREYPQPEEWVRRFEALGSDVRESIWEQALTPCPDCASRAVPVSWAVVAVEEALRQTRVDVEDGSADQP